MTPESIGLPDAERVVVGCILHLPANAAHDLAFQLSAGILTDPQLRKVLEAARTVIRNGTDPDPIAVLGQLRRDGVDRSFVAGRDAGVYLADLFAGVPSVANASTYLLIVREHAWRRRIQETGERLIQAAGRASVEALQELIDNEIKLLKQGAPQAAPCRPAE